MTKLTSLDEMMGVINDTENKTELPISKLVPYSKHEFSLYEGERLEEMIDSIKTFGVLQPIIVRKQPDGYYEILAGHNRTNGAKQAGLPTIPAVIIDADDNLAELIVTETNLVQRSFADMTISEKAAIIQKHYTNSKKQGKRKHLTESIDVAKGDTRELIASEYGITGRDLSRLMRINKLIPSFKQMVDKKELPFIAGVNLSYLDIPLQIVLERVLKDKNKKISLKHSELIKKLNAEDAFILGDAEQIFIDILNNQYLKNKRAEESTVSEPTYPVLLNQEQRKQFLENITEWGLWYTDKNIGADYFKYPLPDSSTIVAVRYKLNPDIDYGDKEYSYPDYFLMTSDNPYLNCYSKTNMTALTEKLKDILPKDETQINTPTVRKVL